MANTAYRQSSVCSKRSKSSDKETCLDRISQLPDVLIQHILSFLPTKEAMATSILSRRWLRAWTSVPILDLEDSPECKICEDLRIGFAQFVDRVLIFNKVTNLDKFCLRTNSFYHPSDVRTWLRAAVERDVKELHITLHGIRHNFPTLKLPFALFTAKKLKVLKLNHGIELDVPGIVFLPSLKVLHLVSAKHTDNESVSRLFAGCPVLEELLLDGFSGNDAINLNISNPTLKWLSIWFYTIHSKYKLKLNAPNLEYLNFQEKLPPEFHIESVSNLVEAKVTFSVIEDTHISFLNALHNAKFLSLDWDWCWKPQVSHKSRTYPLFLNLVRLEFHVGHGGWDMVSHFLQNSHNLEVLVLSKNANCRGLGLECYWKPPKLVPLCLLSRLKLVHFKGFEGLLYQMTLVKYILENSRVLKMMDICTDEISNLGLDSKLYMIKKLTKFRRGSRACQLEFN